MLAMLQKGLRDLASTLYDDQEFRVMSLPRVAFLVSVVAVLAATGAEAVAAVNW